MATFWFDIQRKSFYDYTYEAFIEHLTSDHEIFLLYEGIRIGIYKADKYTLRINEEKHEYYSKRGILEHYIVPGKRLIDIWDDLELIDVY